jgi:hypothetical protein
VAGQVDKLAARAVWLVMVVAVLEAHQGQLILAAAVVPMSQARAAEQAVKVL